MTVKHFVASCILRKGQNCFFYKHGCKDYKILEGWKDKPISSKEVSEDRRSHDTGVEKFWSAEHYSSTQFAGNFKMATHGPESFRQFVSNPWFS